MSDSSVDWAFFSVLDYVNRAAGDDKRTPDATVWSHFLARLGEAVEFVTQSPFTEGAAERASAYHGLLQNVHFGLERMLGSADPYRPVLSRPWWIHPFDWGAANPDAVYHTVALRDDVTYRISGNRGNAAFLSFEFFAGASQAGSIAAADLDADADGNFEIAFGPHERDGNALQVVPGTSSMLTREFFGDWVHARPGRYQIACLDPSPRPWPLLSADRVEREIRALGDWLVATVQMFMGAHAAALAECPNAFNANDTRPQSGLPGIYNGCWNLAEDECLIIEADPPVGAYWGIQLANGLWNTLDFANRQTSLNISQLEREPDGTIRIVVAHHDPGAANWLDTMGLGKGQMLLRFTYPSETALPRPERTLAATRSDWMDKWRDKPVDTAAPVSQYPAPTTRLVRFDELDKHLAGARRVTAQQRQQTIDSRLQSAVRLVSG